MSLSFPPAPTNGQQYQNWVWSSATNSWNPNYAAGFVTSVDGMSGSVSLTGRLTELSRQVVVAASPVSWLQFAMPFTQYDEYEAHGYGLVPTVTTGVNPIFQVGYGAGPTWDNTASYGWTVMQQDSAPSAFYSSGSGNSNWGLIGSGQGSNTSTYSGQWAMRFFQPGHATRRKLFVCEAWAQNSGGVLVNSKYSNIWWPASTPPLTGIRFSYSSGNISEGTFVIYGRTK